MKKAFTLLLLTGLLLLGLVNVVLAEVSRGTMKEECLDQPQHRVQHHRREQTNINPVDQEFARNQLRERLQLSAAATAQKQEMLKLQDPLEKLFSDIEQHWAQEQIREAYRWGLIKGYPDGRYNPQGKISGPEAILMMSRMINNFTREDEILEPPGEMDWDRVPPWAREPLREPTAYKIVRQSQFYNEQQLNRLQFAVMLAKAMGLESARIPEETVAFLDQDEIPDTDLDDIYALRILGVIVGHNGLFYPAQLITRAEACVMLTRVLDILETVPAGWTVEADKLMVTLEENPTTGYRWDFQMDLTGILALVSDEYIPDETPGMIVGAGGERKWVFQSEGPGVVKLTFDYYRPWEEIHTAVDQRTYFVTVGEDGTITGVS